MAAGLFIALEGGDFLGKGTQAVLLAKNLLQLSEDNDILLTNEPTKYANELTERLRTETDAYANAERMTELYIEDRLSHTQRLIQPVLNQGGIVIANRYKLSTCCYQSLQGMSLLQLIELHNAKRIPNPDITLLLDITETTAEARAKALGSLDKFERDSTFRAKVYERYRTLTEMAQSQPELFGHVKTIDGNGSPEEVAQNVLAALMPVYEPWHFSMHGLYPGIRS